MNQILLQDEVTPKRYLQTLLQAYPYTIDDDTVYTLLNKTTYPHPSLITFLKYFADIPKYHVCHQQAKEIPSLLNLTKRMSTLQQDNEAVLHTHQFDFDATIYTAKYSFHNPYAHLPLTKVPFLQSVHLHKPLVFQTPEASNLAIHQSDHFLYKDLSLYAADFIAVSIRIYDKSGIVFVPQSMMGSAIALSQLYQHTKVESHQDFMVICGVTAKQHEAAYYYDATNDLYIGYIGGNDRMKTFPLMTAMIETIYNAICIFKQDLPVHGFMANITKDHKTIGIVFNGCEQCGIHELCYALEQYCTTHTQYHLDLLFEQSGTLHFLDNDISATGTQIGTLVPLRYLDQSYLLSHIHQGIWLNPQREAMLIQQRLAYEKTAAFHKVHAFFYLNNYENKIGIRCFGNLEEAKQICGDGCFNENHQICHRVLANPYGVDELKDKTIPLLGHFLDIMYLNNIVMGEFYTNHASQDHMLLGCQESVASLFAFLEAEKLFQKDSMPLFQTGL